MRFIFNALLIVFNNSLLKFGKKQLISSLQGERIRDYVHKQHKGLYSTSLKILKYFYLTAITKDIIKFESRLAMPLPNIKLEGYINFC